MVSRRMLAASLYPLMLSLLADGPKYGYQIIQRAKALSGDDIKLSNSKLYPLLHRLENEGLLESAWKPSEAGPDRKYYQITTKGCRSLETEIQAWRSLNTIFDQLWGPQVSVLTSSR